jgi:hypothetical protein
VKKDDYYLAQLAEEQKHKINQLENELGVVLIAWEKENEEALQNQDYYEMYEGDRF